MSNVTKEYLIVLLYFLLLLAQAAGETVWLRRKGWLNGAKSALLVGVTDVIGFVVGFTVLFTSVGITFALAWDGSLGKLPLEGGVIIPFLVLVLLFLPALLALLKRGGLSLLKVPESAGRWAFAVVSAVLFWLLPLALTILLTKIFWRFL